MKKSLSFITALSAALVGMLTIVTPGASAQEDEAQGVVSAVQGPGESQAEIEAYWTPERLLSAKPIELHPEVDAKGFPIVTEVPTESARSLYVAGAPPAVNIGKSASRILIPPYLLPKTEAQGPLPPATSSFGAYFTTTRVFPDAATTAGPYKTVGKLFFTDPRTGGNFVCSGSVLRFRIVVTAGHCVAHGSTTAADRYFYSKFMFVPSELSGSAPDGTWTWSFANTTGIWYNNGTVPNQQDVGMLVIADQKLGGSGPFRIGHVTGYLGYIFCNGTNCSAPAISDNNLTILGYPCNLDGCERMEQTNAQTFESGGSNTWIYGSVMRGGASGGPWIQDFGINPSGAPSGLLGNNYVTAVTSYGPTATTPMYLGASAFDVRFNNLLTNVCSHAGTGGC
jgi:V8-like Glu-specific endopeptidase